MLEVHDLAGFLVGDWTITRRIVPGRGAPAGGFTGEARVRPADDAPPTPTGAHPRRLVYDEHGTARIGAHVGTASRRLRYVVSGPRAEVRFDDGRPFHDLDLSSGRWRAEHPCGADRYVVVCTVLDADHWMQHWYVDGPEAAYELITHLRRRHGQ